MAFVKTRTTRHDVTIAEVKPPGGANGKSPSDLVKIGQQMKVMLNNVINYKVASPVVGGILIEGQTCSLYKMDIVAAKFYRMVLLDSFPLCKSLPELMLIPNNLPWLNQLKDIAVETAKKILSNVNLKEPREIEELMILSLNRGLLMKHVHIN